VSACPIAPRRLEGLGQEVYPEPLAASCLDAEPPTRLRHGKPDSEAAERTDKLEGR